MRSSRVSACRSIVKGITTPAEATAALQHNVQGIVASNFGGLLANKDAMILALPNIVDAVAGKVPVLDGRLVPPRHRYPQGAGVRRAGRAARPAGDVGPVRPTAKPACRASSRWRRPSSAATWACAASRT